MCLLPFHQYDVSPSIDEKFRDVEEKFGMKGNLDLVRMTIHGWLFCLVFLLLIGSFVEYHESGNVLLPARYPESA